MTGPGPLETVSGLLAAEAKTLAQGQDLPAATGAYVLLIELAEAVRVPHRGAALAFAPGWYAYVGSARGPGGLKARLARHLAPDKKPHWHVDSLTLIASSLAAFALEGASECDLGARLAASGRFAHAVPGFGSSDCSACTSHLLAWSGGGPD